MRRALLIGLLVIACGGTDATTTVSATTTVATVMPASTTEAVTTTILATSTMTSTTTAADTDADFPLVVSASGLLGYSDGTHWVPGDGVLDVAGGEEYQVVTLEGVAGTATGSSIEACEPSQTPMILLNPPLPVDHGQPGAMGITGAFWDLVPRPVTTNATAPEEILAEAISFLANRGIDGGRPPVAQYLMVDLEGDGKDEELLVTKRVPPDLIGNPGSYSLVLMRKMLDPEVATLVIEFSQGEADSPYVVSHWITAVVDLNGDGKMEIVIDGHYYEGSGTAVWEYQNDDLGPVVALSAGCGA